MVEEGSQGADLTEKLTLEEARASVVGGMSRQGIIDRLSGNRRRIIQQGGEFLTVIERINESTSSREDTVLFNSQDQVLEEPQV